MKPTVLQVSLYVLERLNFKKLITNSNFEKIKILTEKGFEILNLILRTERLSHYT
jgi:hypothetical protein